MAGKGLMLVVGGGSSELRLCRCLPNNNGDPLSNSHEANIVRHDAHTFCTGHKLALTWHALSCRALPGVHESRLIEERRPRE